MKATTNVSETRGKGMEVFLFIIFICIQSKLFALIDISMWIYFAGIIIVNLIYQYVIFNGYEINNTFYRNRKVIVFIGFIGILEYVVMPHIDFKYMGYVNDYLLMGSIVILCMLEVFRIIYKKREKNIYTYAGISLFCCFSALSHIKWENVMEYKNRMVIGMIVYVVIVSCSYMKEQYKKK